MDASKCLPGFLLLLLPLSLWGQEWSKQDSLRLRELLNSDKEITINRSLIKLNETVLHHGHYVDGFDLTLPRLHAPVNQKPRLFSADAFSYSSSFATADYCRLLLSPKLTLQSTSNFKTSYTHFHIHTQVSYSITPRLSLRIAADQNLFTKKSKALPSEVEPTSFNSHLVYKMNRHWEMKGGANFRRNMIRRKWEWVPEVGVSYRW